MLCICRCASRSLACFSGVEHASKILISHGRSIKLARQLYWAGAFVVFSCLAFYGGEMGKHSAIISHSLSC